MNRKEQLLHGIRVVFGGNEYPGDAFLQGSWEGSEPSDEVGPFKGKTDWGNIDASILDVHASALSFFSEAGLRFFLPAFLIADIQQELKSADPLSSLTNGFSDLKVHVTVRGREFVLRSGKSELLNPKRYGASTFLDYARYRLSIFTREEAQTIVAYLEYKRDLDPHGTNKVQIENALNDYWRERAANAPPTESLRRHVKEKNEFVAAGIAAKRQ